MSLQDSLECCPRPCVESSPSQGESRTEMWDRCYGAVGLCVQGWTKSMTPISSPGSNEPS